MSSKFFTNQNNTNSLESRLKDILEYEKPKYLEFLIGYFRISGFNKIIDFLDDIKELKILVGINIDNVTFKSIQNSKLIKEEFSKEQIILFNKDINSNKYLNINILSKMLLTQKIKMRIYNTNNLHAKMYILRDDIKEQRTGLKYNGSVITGSSNLTHSGLSSDGNIEINVELKDNDDIKFAYETFIDIWDNQSREFTKEDVDNYIIPFIKINNRDKEKNNLTTFQVYVKLLIEHFGNRINFINSNDIFVPDGYKQLSYQVEAVNDGIDKLDKHNGFFLSDVVGLGKTVVTAMLCKKLEPLLIKKILIVIPPAIKAQWVDTFDIFKIKNYDIISFYSLDKIDSSKYKLIIVDESHKFKNIKTKRYEKLSQICKDKKVILLSATPQNNSPKDLQSQLNLFQNMKNSTISTCENLDRFFHTLNSQYQDIINSDNGNIDKKSLKNISIQIRDKVLRTIMIRRTRTDIEAHFMYMSELINQGLTMPEVKPLKEHEYEMKEPLNSIFEKTANILVDKLKYERFNTLAYLTTKAKETYYPNESDNIFEYNALSILMRNLLIKRFESSFYSFNISINRQLLKYQEFIKNFKNNKIYLGKKASDILNYDEVINGDYDKFIEKLIEKDDIKILSQNDFKDGYLEKLEADLLILKDLVELWKDNKDDPKIDKFIDEIVSQNLNNNIEKKIVVFTESKDTSKYLETKLPNINKILFITSDNRDDKKQIIRENFDANYPIENQKNDFNIIVTTDTLSEGINLHRSNIIYNYDIPWNATKLIQRIGRVNRIGTKSNFIYVHNFKPSSNIEKLLKLSQKAYVKLQAFHTTLGEDNKIYTENEEVSTVKLFNEYQQSSKERDEELDFLEELREFRDKNIDEFNNIVNLPKELAITTKGGYNKSYIVLDVDDDIRYYCVNDIEVTPISFLEIVKVLKENKNNSIIEYKANSNHIKNSINYCKDEFDKLNKIKAEGKLTKGVEQKAIIFIKKCLKNKVLDKEQFKNIKNAIVTGKIDIITANDILKLENSSKDDIISNIKNILDNIKDNEVNITKKEQVINIILTHTFIKG